MTALLHSMISFIIPYFLMDIKALKEKKRGGLVSEAAAGGGFTSLCESEQKTVAPSRAKIREF